MMISRENFGVRGSFLCQKNTGKIICNVPFVRITKGKKENTYFFAFALELKSIICGGAVVRGFGHWTSGYEGRWFEASPCHRVVSLDKKLSTQCLSPHSSEGVAILSVASCYRNRVKLQPCGPPWLVRDVTFPY